MIDAVVIRRYRALRDVRFVPQRLTLVTGANGTGKSSLYRALTLLQRAATGGLGMAIAQEGGIASICWAGVGEAESRNAKRSGRAIQGTVHGSGSSVVLGLSTEGIHFELEVGVPGFDPDSKSAFNFDPGVVRECAEPLDFNLARGARASAGRTAGATSRGGTCDSRFAGHPPRRFIRRIVTTDARVQDQDN